MLKIAKELLIAVLISGLVFTGFAGCGDDEEEAENEALALPPEASMTIDFSAFDGGEMFLDGQDIPQHLARV